MRNSLQYPFSVLIVTIEAPHPQISHICVRFLPNILSPDGLSEGSADGVTLSLDKVTKTRGHSPFPPCHIRLAHCLSGSRHRKAIACKLKRAENVFDNG